MTTQYPYPTDQFDLVGRVTRSHGLKGDIKVSPLQGPVDDFENYSRVALVAADGRMTELLSISRCRVQGKQVILKLDTIDTKSEADLTASMGVLSLIEERPAEEVDPYGRGLIGAEVLTTEKKVVGTVDSITHNGAHPLMIVIGDREEFLVPLVDEIVVSRDDRQIIIDPPPGLLDINR